MCVFVCASSAEVVATMVPHFCWCHCLAHFDSLSTHKIYELVTINCFHFNLSDGKNSKCTIVRAPEKNAGNFRPANGKARHLFCLKRFSCVSVCVCVVFSLSHSHDIPSDAEIKSRTPVFSCSNGHRGARWKSCCNLYWHFANATALVSVLAADFSFLFQFCIYHFTDVRFSTDCCQLIQWSGADAGRGCIRQCVTTCNVYRTYAGPLVISNGNADDIRTLARRNVVSKAQHKANTEKTHDGKVTERQGAESERTRESVKEKKLIIK